MNDFYSDNPKIGHGQDSGCLYVVATPIGNMEDITLRALNVLKSVDIIAAESVKHTKRLCEHYKIKTKLTRYNQHNQKAKTPELMLRLKSGRDVAIVTNAGTPGISDPGGHLIRRVIEEDLTVTPIPGPSAVSAALSVSGFPSDQFVFQGFLPTTSGKRRRVLEGLTFESRPMVFFEAPHRILAMLSDLKEVLSDREMVLVRELTKVFEDVKRGTVSHILEYLTPDKTRGEFTLVVGGVKGIKAPSPGPELIDRIQRLLKEDGRRSIKDIAKQLAREEGIAYRLIYKECIAAKRRLEKVESDGAS